MLSGQWASERMQRPSRSASPEGHARTIDALCTGGGRGETPEEEEEGFAEGLEGGGPREGDLVLNGTLRSANCGLLLRVGAVSTHLAEHYAKAVRYTACITALTLLQVGKNPAPCPARPPQYCRMPDSLMGACWMSRGCYTVTCCMLACRSPVTL